MSELVLTGARDRVIPADDLDAVTASVVKYESKSALLVALWTVNSLGLLDLAPVSK